MFFLCVVEYLIQMIQHFVFKSMRLLRWHGSFHFRTTRFSYIILITSQSFSSQAINHIIHWYFIDFSICNKFMFRTVLKLGFSANNIDIFTIDVLKHWLFHLLLKTSSESLMVSVTLLLQHCHQSNYHVWNQIPAPNKDSVMWADVLQHKPMDVWSIDVHSLTSLSQLNTITGIALSQTLTKRSENNNTPQPLNQWMNSPFMGQQVGNC